MKVAGDELFPLELSVELENLHYPLDFPLSDRFLNWLETSAKSFFASLANVLGSTKLRERGTQQHSLRVGKAYVCARMKINNRYY